jgi:putative Holliday junction resolvase
MRALALDVGERRIGVALSDPGGRVATPLTVLDAAQARDGNSIKRIIEEYEVDVIIVGLPLSLDGSEGPQARRVRAQVQRLARFLPDAIEFVDERLSSAEAKRRMREAGAAEKDQRGSVDMVAASILLQSFLDARSASDSESDGPA